jgi:hypothetical protein
MTSYLSPAGASQDDIYFKIMVSALEVCKLYKPRFGHGVGLSLSEFQSLYQADPFYAWLGLDSPLMYAAHKAAGGMTSIYRQVGIGCQRLFQRILMDSLSLTPEQAAWSYQVDKSSGGKRTLSLDGRIPFSEVAPARQLIVSAWLKKACQEVGVVEEVAQIIKGAVFETRQGYKSKDAKRQNADIANASSAYAEAYLPVILLLSTQIDDEVASRYKKARWLFLKGTLNGSATDSTYVFCREILGYDLADFFQRYSPNLKQELEAVLTALLG